MNADFHREISGKLATRVVGAFEVIIEIVLLIWFAGDVAMNKEKQDRVTFWIFDTRHYLHETLVGAYFSVAVIMSILLVYSTFATRSLKTNKYIATAWCIFRALSLFAVMALIVQNGGNFTNLRSVLMVGFLVIWALSIYFVSLFLTGLDIEIEKQVAPQYRKRKVSSVSVLTNGGDLESPGDHRNQQYPQFRAYLHRPSLQSSAIPISGEDEKRENPYVLAVPDCRF